MVFSGCSYAHNVLVWRIYAAHYEKEYKEYAEDTICQLETTQQSVLPIITNTNNKWKNVCSKVGGKLQQMTVKCYASSSCHGSQMSQDSSSESASNHDEDDSEDEEVSK